MKKNLLILIFSIALLTAGCVKDDGEILQSVTIKEPACGSAATEHPDQESKETEQNGDVGNSLDDYIVSVKEQSDFIKASLEYDALTQVDMNLKSQELYELWDEALNYLWSELKSVLPEEEFAELQIEQRLWIAEKEKAIEETGKQVEGGTLYALIVNGEGARITEERVYVLYELLNDK